MLSHVDLGPPAPCPARFNLAEHVLARGARAGQATALEILGPDGVEIWDYTRLLAAVAGVGEWFSGRDLPARSPILLRLGNTVDFPVIFLGAVAAGHLPVPTSAALGVAEITRIAGDLDPALTIAGPGVALPEIAAPVVEVGRLRASSGPAVPDYRPAAADDPAYIVYTSGSSGAPKGVIHAHRAIWARRMMVDGWVGLTARDRVMHAGAFNWTYTLGTGLLDPWTVGATALIPTDGTSVDALAAMIAHHDVSIFAAVPGVYRKLLRRELAPMPVLRHALSAGEKLAPALRAAWQARTGTDIHEAFGQSECSTFISGAPARPAPAGTLGFPQPGRRIAVLGPGGPVPRGQPDMLAVHRSDPGLALGYVGAPLPDAEWFATGDSVCLREDGALDYLGRIDDLLTSGGFRVSPVEVEDAMTGHPDIIEAAAVDVSLDAETRVIAVFYVADRALDEAGLGAHAAARLASFKRPRVFRRVPALPRGANGKLLRPALRDQFKARDDQT